MTRILFVWFVSAVASLASVGAGSRGFSPVVFVPVFASTFAGAAACLSFLAEGFVAGIAVVGMGLGVWTG